LRLGAVEFLRKPLRLSELLCVVGLRPAAQAGPTRAPVHVLVIDPDTQRRAEALRAVERIGHLGTGITSHEEALARRGREAASVLMIAPSLWEQGGRDLVRRLADREQGVRLLVLGDEGVANRGPELMDQGVQAVLVAPLSTLELGEVVERLLQGPAARVRERGVDTGPVAALRDPEAGGGAEPEPESADGGEPDDPGLQDRFRELAEALRNGSVEVTNISPVALELQGLVADGGSNLPDLVGKIEQDPNLAAEVLKAANAAAYRGMPPVLDLFTAGRRLGGRRLGEVAQMAALRGAFTTRAQGWGKLLGRMWRHTVVSAQAARMLAERVGDPSRGEVYTMALFANLGEVLVVDLFKSSGAEAPLRGIADGSLRRAMDAQHAALGALLLRSWKLPSSVASIALSHHDPSPLPPGTPIARHAWMIGACQQAVAQLPGFDYKRRHREGPPLAAAAASLGLDSAVLAQVAEAAAGAWSGATETA
jgi:HD-like signal output (HDOD) protein/FixJ family two-component response regulator